MKKILPILLLILLSSSAFSQRFGNEWITFGQEYLKITVNQNGIYRINKSDLDAQLFTTTGKPLKNYQLFHRGKEIAIKVIGNPNGDILSGDFIYFYAKSNDGEQDSELYKHGAERVNPYFSLYSDNTAYFLTVGNTTGKRMDAAPVANTGLISETHYLSKLIDNQVNQYNQDITKSGIASVLQSYYEPWEGMTSWPYWAKNTNAAGTVLAPRPFNRSYTLPNFLSGTTSLISFETKATTRRSEGKTISYTLENGAPTGSVTGTFSVGSFFTGNKLNTSIANITGTLDVNMNSIGAFDRDLWSFFYIYIKYPTSLAYVSNKEYELLPNVGNISRLNLTTPTGNVSGFDITDFENQKEINLVNNGSNIDVYVNNTVNSKNIFLSSTISNPVSTKKIVFTQIDPSLYDYLIISDSRIATGANEYKTYRESSPGGSYDVHLAFISDLYDQFSYGERTPIAIRRYADYMTNTPKVMKYLFIIGKSISITSQLKLYFSSPTQTFASPNILPFPHADNPEDYVPTFGYPASDILLTSGLKGTIETIPAIPTGRLVVSTNAEISGYLTKVKEHATRTNSDFQKKLLHIAGPQYGSEITTLPAALETARNYAVSGTFAASATDFVTMNKDPLILDVEGHFPNLNVPQTFYDRVNDGVGIMAYYGHGSSDEVAYNIGYLSKETINSTSMLPVGGNTRYLDMPANSRKYSLFIGSGCGLSNSFFGNKDIASDWVNTPNKGSINAISNTSLSYETYDTRALLKFYETLFGSAPNGGAKKQATNAMTNRAIGDIFKQAAINNVNSNAGGDPNGTNPDDFFTSNLDQTILLGDPSIAIFRDPTLLPLSLTLLDVKAMNENRKTVVSWKTENEVDFNGFDVERSYDAKKFVKIGFVKGNNNLKEQNNYSFDDESPLEGLNYYRLKMIDNDGKSNYSKIVSTEFELPENNLTIFGNPSNDFQFKFKLNGYIENSAKLFDIKGNSLNLKIQKIEANLYNVFVPNTIVKGTYLFKLENQKGKSFNKKVIFE
jgi:Peptidase family C25